VFVSLDAEPIGTVVLTITSGDTGEFTVIPATLSFDSTDWSDLKRVDLSGVADGVPDGNQEISLTVAVDDTMSDDAWDALGNESVTVTVINIDP
jgi:hypothetical protein